MAFDDDLAELLTAFEPRVADTARTVVRVVAAARPDMSAKVQPGWRSVNFRHPRAGFVCGVFPIADKVLLAFEHGRELDHPRLVDNGKVKKMRWVPFEPGEKIDADDLGVLLMQAIALRS
jgi:hypothetical protein